MSKHTPRPWIEQGQGIVLNPVSGGTIQTQRIETSLGFIEIIDGTNEPDCNFQLILSAHELLQALKDCETLFNRIANHHGAMLQGTDCDTLTMRQTIAALMAQAEGAK